MSLSSPALTIEFLQKLPKAELHCHLLGSVRKETFEALVLRAGGVLNAQEVQDFYTRGEKPVGVLRVLRALESSLLRTPEDFYRLTLEYLQDAAAHAVRYAEFFWNPTGTADVPGLSYAQVLPAFRRAIADAAQQFGIVGRLLPSIDREASPRAALQMVEWVCAHRCDEVPGIGMDYRENDRPPELFEEAYALARQSGLKTTAHAGEFGMPWTNVQTAIDRLQVDRIDHGYTIVDNPALAERARQMGLVFTVVPTNSYYLRTLPPERWAQDHPIRKMRALGLKLHPNTDDPTLHHVNPTQAWGMMVEHFGCTLQDIEGFMHNSLDAAWIDVGTRDQWRRQWSAQFKALSASS